MNKTDNMTFVVIDSMQHGHLVTGKPEAVKMAEHLGGFASTTDNKDYEDYVASWLESNSTSVWAYPSQVGNLKIYSIAPKN